MRSARAAAAVAIAATCGAALSGCAHQDAAGLASRACIYVHRSLAIERESDRARGARAASLRLKALTQLSLAEPLAAVAAGEHTTWQALDATLSETNRVPEHDLVYALRAQCSGLGG